MSLNVDDADGWRFVASVQDQQIAAVGREDAGHGESIDGELFAGGLDLPAGVEEEASAGKGADLFAAGVLRDEDGGGGEASDEESGEREAFFHSEYLCAMGKRRPMPNALVVTFRPGAACCRLYSLRSTLSAMSFTRASGSSSSSGDLLGSFVVLDIGAQDGVEDVIGRKAVGVFLVGAQFGGGRFDRRRFRGMALFRRRLATRERS